MKFLKAYKGYENVKNTLELYNIRDNDEILVKFLYCFHKH